MSSLRRLINENCKSCIYDKEANGSWRRQVENCTVNKCAFWLVRPKSMDISKRLSKKELAVVAVVNE